MQNFKLINRHILDRLTTKYKFTLDELKVFSYLCKNIDNENIMHNEISNILIREGADLVFKEKIKKCCEKFSRLNFNLSKNEENNYVGIIVEYKIDRMVIKIPQEIKKILKDFTKNFNNSDYERYLSLNSVYSKALFRIFKEQEFGIQNKIAIEIGIEDLREKLNTPNSFTTLGNMKNKVLIPINKELSIYFNDFRYEEIRQNNERKSKVLGVKFSCTGVSTEIPMKKQGRIKLQQNKEWKIKKIEESASNEKKNIFWSVNQDIFASCNRKIDIQVREGGIAKNNRELIYVNFYKDEVKNKLKNFYYTFYNKKEDFVSYVSHIEMALFIANRIEETEAKLYFFNWLKKNEYEILNLLDSPYNLWKEVKRVVSTEGNSVKDFYKNISFEEKNEERFNIYTSIIKIEKDKKKQIAELDIYGAFNERYEKDLNLNDHIKYEACTFIEFIKLLIKSENIDGYSEQCNEIERTDNFRSLVKDVSKEIYELAEKQLGNNLMKYLIEKLKEEPRLKEKLIEKYLENGY